MTCKEQKANLLIRISKATISDVLQDGHTLAMICAKIGSSPRYALHRAKPILHFDQSA